MRSFAINPQTRRDVDNIADKPPSASRLWATEFGRQVLLLERRLLAHITRSLHGDHVLWLGEDSASLGALRRCMVRQVSYMQFTGQSPAGEAPNLVGQGSEAQAELPRFIGLADELPLQSRSVDGIVLHHALERMQDPRPVLREAQRVLAPGGRMIIVGFNPMSWYGLRRLYAKVRDDALSDHRLINPMRLFDWLALLGLELERLPQYVDYGAPVARVSRAQIQPRLGRSARAAAVEAWTLPFGGVVLISAVKQAVAGKPQWKRADRDPARVAEVAYPRVASWLKTDR